MGPINVRFSQGIVTLNDVANKQDFSAKLKSALEASGATVKEEALNHACDIWNRNKSAKSLDCRSVDLQQLVKSKPIKLAPDPEAKGSAAPAYDKKGVTAAFEAQNNRLGGDLAKAAPLKGVHIDGAVDANASMKPKVNTQIADAGPIVKQGAASLQVEKWSGATPGFTVLIDVKHNDQMLPNEWTHLEIGVAYQKDGKTQVKPLKLEWPAQTYITKEGAQFNPTQDKGCLQPKGHHAQVALNISEADLLKQVPWATSAHQLSVRPLYSNYEHGGFHSTQPSMAALPISVAPAKEERQTFDIVPITLQLPLSQKLTTNNTFVKEGTLVTTTMETEAEYTVKTEAEVVNIVKNCEDLVKHPAKLTELLGPGWSMKRVEKYDMINADGSLAKNPNNGQDWTQKDVERFGVGKKRPELTELGVAQPGIIHDVYFVENDGRVLRTRSNAIEENLLSAKGFSVRDGDVMRRYTKQVPLKTTPEGKPGAQLLVNDPELNFGEVINPKGEKITMPKANILTVDSERYRYKLVCTNTNPATEIELSCDISTGTTPQGKVQSFGFEFGLGHLGASTAIVGQSDEVSTPSADKPVVDGAPMSKAELQSFSAVKPRVHDKEDLKNEKILTGESVDLFKDCVSKLKGFVAKDMETTLAGEKAKVMRQTLKERLS